ncbi:MAG: hypothetical protein ABSF00_00955 [Candidatus Bathyarchaeia archaeon]
MRVSKVNDAISTAGASSPATMQPETEGTEINFRKSSLATLERRFQSQTRTLYHSTRQTRKYGEWWVILQKLQVTYRLIVEATRPEGDSG